MVSSVKGGVQVRERVEEHGSGVIRSEPTIDNAHVNIKYTLLVL